ncbi:flagellar protein FlaG [Bacillus coahuilensis]|uniref:flagellar protein FlaG n=1 Tax=Bacillus coahuilensis TaxID=408580 RepID=UPI00075056BE|nr:flagellar protein FlaG [Bacillus coahuilensis]
MIEKITINTSSLREASVDQTTSSATREIEEILPIRDLSKYKNDDSHSPLLSKEKAEKTVDTLNQFLENTQTALKFQFHDKLEEYYVTIVDEKSNEVVREVPPKNYWIYMQPWQNFLALLLIKRYRVR